jgi:hypothetical protein
MGLWARRLSLLAVAGLLWCGVTLPTHAALSQPFGYSLASSVVTFGVSATTQTKKRKAKKAKPALQPDRTPSGETVADRERRLMRECKGRPNAGACLGFAS